MKTTIGFTTLFFIILSFQIACSSKQPMVVSKARNRNFGILFSNITSTFPKETFDESIHRVADTVSRIYTSTVHPLNFHYNKKIDYKAVYLSGLKNIDTLILIDGEVKTPAKKHYYTYQGTVYLLNPSNFKIMLDFPFIVSKRDYSSLPEPEAKDKKNKNFKTNQFLFLFEKKIVQAIQTILPDPNNFPRLNLVELGDVLFEEHQYEYALELYRKFQNENPDYQNDLSITIKLSNNIETCLIEMRKNKENQLGFVFEVDMGDVKESYQPLFRSLVLESFIEEELKTATTNPVTLSIDFDEVFKKGMISLTMQFSEEYYRQNLIKFQVPLVYKEKKTISFLPYKSIFNELLLLQKNLTKKVLVLFPERKISFEIEFNLISFRRRIVLQIGQSDPRFFRFPAEIKYVSPDKQWYSVASVYPTVTEDRGLFVLDNFHDQTGMLSPAGMVYNYFFP